ncbi:hypothetical protein BpHYR1_049756 [Brachionus plicatilis]|uniref:Uncharacterized protein n=1 Tax=Brachionus plicatilis TaxID=10195 RepID=A0A3M7RM38_BRAPC|nr:hypothetical protein BpHYR1_049756 [Brachionus plicatilis]
MTSCVVATCHRRAQINALNDILISIKIYRKPLRIGAAVNTKPYNYRNAANPSHFIFFAPKTGSGIYHVVNPGICRFTAPKTDS